MADSTDSEKDEFYECNASTPISPTSPSATDSEKNEHIPRQSHSGNDSIEMNPDPLAPLQQALTPDLFTDAEHLARPELTYTKSGASAATSISRPSAFEVDFTPDDPEDPHNWPLWYRGMVLGFVSFATWTTVLYSTSYTSSMPGMMKEFNEPSETIATLGVTTYMIGLAVGSLILAPISEIWGRRPVYFGSLLFYCLMTLPCSLATGLAEVQVVRFFGALAGAAMISNSPGTVADMTHENYRALAFSIWSIGPMNGPVTGPLIGGFAAEYLGWRWTNWLVMIFSGCAWLMCASMKETYAPTILRKKAARMRKQTGDERWWSRYDQKVSIIEVLKVNLKRPIVLLWTEPILWFLDAYVAIVYGILYLCFVAYPLIYTGLRGWSAGITGLSFMGIGVGTMLAIVTEPLARRLVNSHKKDPSTGRVPPEASVSIVCIASILCPIGQLWFSWTSVPITIHWIWPILAGIPFGAGNCLVFIYASNYIAGCYGVYSASALAGNSVVRSLMGGSLPLAGPSMYAKLSPQWAGTLLGAVQVLLIPIPFVFYKWGAKIRTKSPLIRQLREDLERSEKRAVRAKRQQERQNATDRGRVLMADEAGYADGDEESEPKRPSQLQPQKVN